MQSISIMNKSKTRPLSKLELSLQPKPFSNRLTESKRKSLRQNIYQKLIWREKENMVRKICCIILNYIAGTPIISSALCFCTVLYSSTAHDILQTMLYWVASIKAQFADRISTMKHHSEAIKIRLETFVLPIISGSVIFTDRMTV